MKKRYPREPLVSVRRDRVDRRAHELADAERQATAERTALHTARARRASAETRAHDDGAAERSRLELGLARAHDLTRGEVHRVSSRLRVEALGVLERRAEKQTESAERAVHDARTALAGARADARALERDKARFQKTAERAEAAAEDDAGADFHAVFSRRREI